jgi:hypothetical protein
MAQEVTIMSIPLGVVTAGTHLIFKAPSDGSGGGLTVLGAGICALTAGTITVQFVTLSDLGTPVVNGTINTTAMGGTLAPGVPAVATITDGWVDGGEWVGMITSATAVLGDFVSLRYTMGR